MSDDAMHVVFGVGQVGRALAVHLAGLGLHVRAVSLTRPAGLPADIDWWSADANDAESAAGAVKGAAVVYQCLNAPYAHWREKFPPLQRGVMQAAERTDALLVSLENVYAYGPTTGRPMTEDLPLAATSDKGRTRAAMTRELHQAAAAGRVQIAIGRASDFFGAGVTESTLGKQVFAHAVAERRAVCLGNVDLLHTYSYLPDIAAGLATLGTDPRAAGQVWHLPGPETVTTRRFVAVMADQLGHPVAIRSLPGYAVHALGHVNPRMHALDEMAYEFEEPFVLDTSKYGTTFGEAGTALETAVAETIAWYRATSVAG